MLLEKALQIPRKPKTAPVPVEEDLAATVSELEPTTGKRKREAEDTDVERLTKRVAGFETNGNGDGNHPIVLDDSANGAILIDD